MVSLLLLSRRCRFWVVFNSLEQGLQNLHLLLLREANTLQEAWVSRILISLLLLGTNNSQGWVHGGRLGHDSVEGEGRKQLCLLVQLHHRCLSLLLLSQLQSGLLQVDVGWMVLGSNLNSSQSSSSLADTLWSSAGVELRRWI